MWYSGKFTCARRQFTCVLREVLAASKQVNLPVFTGKLHVTQVNCARDLFTCELHVKLPAFASNFARASFTVWYIKSRKTFLFLNKGIYRLFTLHTCQNANPSLHSCEAPGTTVQKRFQARSIINIKNRYLSYPTSAEALSPNFLVHVLLALVVNPYKDSSKYPCTVHWSWHSLWVSGKGESVLELGADFQRGVDVEHFSRVSFNRQESVELEGFVHDC